MKKTFDLPCWSICIVAVSLGWVVAATDAQAVGGFCSGGVCSGGTDGSPAGRERSRQKLHENLKKIAKSRFSPEQAAQEDDKAIEQHQKVVKAWIKKEHPQLAPGTTEHTALLAAEMAKDTDTGAVVEEAQGAEPKAPVPFVKPLRPGETVEMPPEKSKRVRWTDNE